jgi:REP-associated tyrosine transposase
MRNHFHLLVRIKGIDDPKRSSDRDYVSQKFGNFLNAYAKAINKAYNRTGSLFEHPFGRIVVDSDAYFTCLVAYIHRNSQKHGFVTDFREWPFSSYHACLAKNPTRVRRTEILDWFGGLDGFIEFHRQTETDAKIKKLIEVDW